MEIVVEGSTVVLGKPECSFNPHGEAKELTVLQKGESVPVLGTEYTKDCMVYKIKLADGRVGYVTFGDEFRVIEHYDTTFSVLVEDSTNLMAEPDSVDAPGNEVIAILHAGEQGKVISDNYWNRTTYYNIKLQDGRIGYVKLDEKIRVIKEQKK